MDRDKSSTQVYPEPERTDNIPSKQDPAQAIENADLSGINFPSLSLP